MLPKRALLFSGQCEVKGFVHEPHHVPPGRRIVHVGTLRTLFIISWQGGRLEKNWRRNMHFYSPRAPHVPPKCSGCSCISCNTLMPAATCAKQGAATSLCASRPVPLAAAKKGIISQLLGCERLLKGGSIGVFARREGCQQKQEIKVIKWSCGHLQAHCFCVSLQS